ncbi:MAG: polyphosphate kinase 1 [Oscillospiraceae bacterium]|jgi:polyphosphate kinase|nr:polyphosphate kinase 1 [Oscillospiraceae bacterium]
MKKKDSNLLYNNREISWLDFNFRVLNECFRKDNFLADKLKFLAISASNLDEFFMVRVAGIMEQINSGYTGKDFSELTPKQQMIEIDFKAHKFVQSQYECFSELVLPMLRKYGFRFVKFDEVSRKQANFIKSYFDKILFPVLTPIAIDKIRPFPLLTNKSLNIIIRLTKGRGQNFKIVQVPSILPRFLKLPSGKKKNTYMLLEDILISNLPKFFNAKEIRSAFSFRITRNADLDIDEEAEDLLIEIKKSIKKRDRGTPVRLEITTKMDLKTKKFLCSSLNVKKYEVYSVNGPIDLTFLSKFAELEEMKSYKSTSALPIDPPADFYNCESFFKTIREQDRMIHHPYESFDPVINLINEAASDKNVLAIKQTLYRVSDDSPVVGALMKAAENGKQVTVLVELKARFDEENNILWAKKLEHAGCHVIYGVPGLKTHCKILLIARKEKDRIRRYLHLATGNYNEITAQVYTDIGIFTCKEIFGIEGSLLFNELTGGSNHPKYSKIITSPADMREFFKKSIKNEIKNKKRGLSSGITFKVNSLSDPEIIKLLRKASNAGVKIFLIVRGICCLIPGINRVSKNIVVLSIIGQLLEHSRIFKFECAGKPKIFIGSADLMQRNLDRRIEVMFPIEDENLKKRTIKILDIMMKDNVNARYQISSSAYVKFKKKGKKIVNSQLEFSKIARKDLLKKIQKSNS